VASS